MPVSGLVFNRKNRANGKKIREFNWCMIESRNTRVGGYGNGDKECIGSGNMAWIITAIKTSKLYANGRSVTSYACKQEAVIAYR